MFLDRLVLVFFISLLLPNVIPHMLVKHADTFQHKFRRILAQKRFHIYLATFAAEKTFGPEKCPVYLKLPWIGNVSSKFENQINKAITSCFYAVKPNVVYSTRAMLPSAKKDSIPTTQKSCAVYEFSYRCEARYV